MDQRIELLDGTVAQHQLEDPFGLFVGPGAPVNDLRLRQTSHCLDPRRQFLIHQRLLNHSGLSIRCWIMLWWQNDSWTLHRTSHFRCLTSFQILKLQL